MSVSLLREVVAFALGAGALLLGVGLLASWKEHTPEGRVAVGMAVSFLIVLGVIVNPNSGSDDEPRTDEARSEEFVAHADDELTTSTTRPVATTTTTEPATGDAILVVKGTPERLTAYLGEGRRQDFEIRQFMTQVGVSGAPEGEFLVAARIPQSVAAKHVSKVRAILGPDRTRTTYNYWHATPDESAVLVQWLRGHSRFVELKTPSAEAVLGWPTTTTSAPATVTSTTVADGSGRPEAGSIGDGYRVTKWVDGDTFWIEPNHGDASVRLQLVDTPEVHYGDEPCGPEASQFTKSFLSGRSFSIRKAPTSPDRDTYGRYLYEVIRDDGQSLNEALVQAGLADIGHEYRDEDPDLYRRLTAIHPSSPSCGSVAPPTTPPPTTQPSSSGGARYVHPKYAGYPCSSSYPDVCIPTASSWGRDIDCPKPGIDNRSRLPVDEHFRNIRVVGSDEHRLDGEGDGKGCESW